jgi:hypothetical protein
MKDQTKICAQPVGVEMNGNVANTTTIVIEDSMAEFLSAALGDTKGSQIVKYIDAKFRGDVDSCISFMIKQSSPEMRKIATTLAKFQSYQKDMMKARQEASRPQRTRTVRKDPVIQPKKTCEICGRTDSECRSIKVTGAELICCPGCQRLDDSQQVLTGVDKYNYLLKQAGLTEAVNEDNHPVITVMLERGLPQHPVSKDYRLVIPNITDELKQELRGADKVTVMVMGVRGDRTVKVKLLKAHQRELPERKSFFAQIFYREGYLHVEAAGVSKRISLPREKKDDIMARRELWGMWKLEILKEEKEFIFALPVEKVKDEDVPDQQHPKVFFATVRMFDDKLQITSEKQKRITVPREMMPRLRYGLGVWKMRVLSEGEDYIFSKPIERIDSGGINKREYAARLNELQSKGKLEL